LQFDLQQLVPHVGKLAIFTEGRVTKRRTKGPMQGSPPIAFLIHPWVVDKGSPEGAYPFKDSSDRQQPPGSRGRRGRFDERRDRLACQVRHDDLGVGCGYLFAGVGPQYQPRLILLSERSRSIQLCQGVPGHNTHRFDPIVISDLQHHISAGRRKFLVPHLEVVGLLPVSVEVLPRETGLRLVECFRNGVPEDFAHPRLDDLGSGSQGQPFETEPPHTR
jgi:hypothetical protein